MNVKTISALGKVWTLTWLFIVGVIGLPEKALSRLTLEQEATTEALRTQRRGEEESIYFNSPLFSISQFSSEDEPMEQVISDNIYIFSNKIHSFFTWFCKNYIKSLQSFAKDGIHNSFW